MARCEDHSLRSVVVRISVVFGGAEVMETTAARAPCPVILQKFKEF